TADQLALALRDEVADLEAAGIGIIQVDEPALRELLPVRRAEQAEYLRWSVESFRLPPAASTWPRSYTPTCAIRSSARLSTLSTAWMPMSPASKPRVRGWNSWQMWPNTASAALSARAC